MSDSGLLGKLPVELRKKIYAFAFVEEHDIKLDKYGNGTQVYNNGGGANRRQRKAFFTVVLRNHSRKPKHRGQIFNASRRRWETAPIDHALGLLRVNKQIHDEATAILYGGNHFELRCWGTLERFLHQIGSAGQHLRAISLTARGLTTFVTGRRAIVALSVANDLRTLGVCHFDVCTSNSSKDDEKLEELVKVCKPFLESLRVAYKARGLSAKALDVIKTVPPGWSSTCRRTGCRGTALDEVLRKKIAGELSLSLN